MIKNKSVVLLLFVLIILITASLIYIRDQSSIKIACISPDPCDQISQTGGIHFEFSQPVDASRVEALWETNPSLDANWEWLDKRHAIWSPMDPLPVGQVLSFHVNPGIAGIRGQKIRGIISWDFKVRSPIILALGNTTNGHELFSTNLDENKETTQISVTGGNLQDFAPSPNGENILLSVQNIHSGVDLWVTNRQGEDDYLLLDCGRDKCYSSAWSPKMDKIVFSREIFSYEKDAWGLPQIYILDLISDKSTPIIIQSGISGSNPSFSPDGSWISFWDELSGGIELVNMQSGEFFLLETTSGTMGCWSPDSRGYYYSDILISPGSFQSTVLRAEVDSQSIAAILGEDQEGLSIGIPACNPARPELAAVSQSNIQIAGRELMIFDLENNKRISVSSDLSRIPTHYAWSSDGNRLIFQLNQLKGEEGDTRILVWDNAKREYSSITEGMKFPKWLP